MTPLLDVGLTQRKTELESDIAALEATLRPLERDLALKKQEYDLVSRLVGLRTGAPPNPATGPSAMELAAPVRIGPTLRLSEAGARPIAAPEGGDDEPVFAEYHGIWADICEVHGWPTGKDSAHRVVIREDPEVHSRVAHQCRYDGETYP